MGIGEFYSLICALAWAISIILFRRVGETMPPFALNLFKNLVMLVLMLPTVALFAADDWRRIPMWVLGLSLLSGFIGIGVADTYYFRALNRMGASRIGVAGMMYSPWVIVLSALFLQEQLQFWQWVGVVVVLGGLLLVSWPENTQGADIDQRLIRLGFIDAALAMFLMATGIVMAKDMLETQSFFWIVLLRLCGGIVGQLLIMLASRSTADVWQAFRAPHHWPSLIGGSIIGTYIAMMLWMAGYKYADASIAAILNESAAVFILVLAWWFLGERMTKRQLAGSGVAFVGVLAVVLGDML